MSDKILNTRVKQKIDTKANWDKAVNFVPLKGEIIVYSDLNKIKIGDGAKKIGELPFLADNDTKVTSAANHYTPIADSGSELTATLSGTAGAYAKDTEYTVLTGVKAQRDAKGHVTGITYTAQKIKDTNTDTNTSHSHSAGIGLVGNGSAGTSGTYTYKVKLRSETALTVDSAAATTTSGRVYPIAVDKSGYLSVNVPWTDTNTDTKVTSAANHYMPTADSSAQLSVDASGTTTAAWNSTSLVTGVNLQRDSKGHVTGLTVDSIKMPANPNTDTHYNAYLYAGPKSTNAAGNTTNGNTYLKLIENDTIRTQCNIKGSGATTVTTDIHGQITINTPIGYES